MTPTNKHNLIGVGPTETLSLRVSVATLTKVVFIPPQDGDLMLALEHKATLVPGDGKPRVVVKAQPFGGAIRLISVTWLQGLAANFHFDSVRSRSACDFRIFIRPADWDTVRDFILGEFKVGDGSVIERDPTRELVEEIRDTLGVELKEEQYTIKPAGIFLENEPGATTNLYSSDDATVRVYRIFEAQIRDPDLIGAMVANCDSHPKSILQEMAAADAQRGGLGWANAVLVAPLEQVRSAYLALSPEQRCALVPFKETLLDGNVSAILKDIVNPRYRDISDF